MQAALATLPWVELGSVKMDFTKRELTFGFKEKDAFDAEAVKAALAAQRFPNVELLSGPS